MRNKLDGFDKAILRHIQIEGNLGPSELSTRVHLSASQCSRRLQRLHDDGYVRHIAAILNPGHLNLGIGAYVAVRLRQQGPEPESAFKARIAALPEVVSCDYTTGEVDFILRVQTKDLETYTDFLSSRLMVGQEIENVRSSIIMKTLKNTTAVSLDYC